VHRAGQLLTFAVLQGDGVAALQIGDARQSAGECAHVYNHNIALDT